MLGRKKTLVGLDIGSNSVKAIEMTDLGDRFAITAYSQRPVESKDAVVDAVNLGEIHRYLTKPWNDDDLLLTVHQALQQYDLVTENRRLTELTQKQNSKLNPTS